MAHRLAPLLRPRSIAVVGATERSGSVGRRTVHNLLTGGYGGRLYAVNPTRQAVLGVPCHAALSDLPEPVEHAVFCVGDARIEAALTAAIDHGVRAVTIMSQLLLPGDDGLAARIGGMVRETGLLVCGPNGMGFYNCRDGVWLCGFDTRDNHRRGGNVTLISHSGAGMSGIVDCEERIDFNLAVSTGQEFTVSMADYLDFVIDEHEPRAVGLFMETARDPEALAAALAKADRRSIPVVALKVGRTTLSARLARSHSGAIAGRDAAYDALFERHGVQRVEDMDELATALIMFAQPHAVGDGGLVALHDSGGERQLLVDLADRLDTPLADISDTTRRRLADLLDPGLPPVNPLDAWGAGGPEADRIMQDCLAALMADADAALGAVVHDRGPLGALYPEYADYLRAGHRASGKPAFLVSNRQGSGSDPAAVSLTREGFPVLDGLRSFLVGVSCLLAHRDHRRRDEPAPPLDPARVGAALALLPEAEPDEAEAASFLAALGLPLNPCRVAEDEVQAVRAAEALGYPAVLKTAERGIAHKTERGGVRLGLPDADAVRAAWRELAERIGPRVLVAPMVMARGVELTLGFMRDEQFGPLVVMGLGGERVEALRDSVCALPPFAPATARRLLDRLRGRALLGRARGGDPPDLDAFCAAASLFSAAVASLDDSITEIDLNPVLVHAGGCVALDALLLRLPVTGHGSSDGE